MADNITAPATGVVLATDDVGGVQYPRTKLSVGDDGVAADVSEANPLPVSVADVEYETIAADQADQVLGATGAVGDLLISLLIVPSSTSPGAVTISDGAGAAITVFAGGADSITTLHPFSVPLGIRSVAGAWSVSTGADVSVVASGNFA
jgi:hypothetical protein